MAGCAGYIRSARCRSRAIPSSPTWLRFTVSSNSRSSPTSRSPITPRCRRSGGLAGLGALTHLEIYDNAALQTIEGLAGLGALTQLTISDNDALQTIEGLADLGALTQLRISYNAALQTIEGLAGLKGVEELRLHGAFLRAALAKIATLPALQRLMLPINLQGTELDRAKGLPPVEVRFVEPGSDEWWNEWKPGET
jgi:Leucine-rich repeat (LRR) protein